MSLLLLLPGATVAANNDRTFGATWTQAAATWAATAVNFAVAPDAGTEFPVRMGPYTQIYGRFIQRPASWRAEVDVNDDEITLLELGEL